MNPNVIDQTGYALQGSFHDVWYTILMFVPQLIMAVILVIAGWVLGVLLYRLIVKVVHTLRIDSALRAAGVHEAVKEVGFNLDIARFLASLVMWFFILVSVVAALEVLGLTRVTLFLEQVVLLYIPQIVVASLILIFAAIIAEFVKKVISGSARVTGSHSANFTGTVAKWAIWIVAVLAALTQLGIAPGFEQTLFTGIVLGLSLAFGLAFGLGGRDAAARVIEHIRSEIAHEHHE